jgi:hypothetical protein
MRIGLKLFMILLLGLVSLYAAEGVPYGALNVTQQNSSRFVVNQSSSAVINAQAGNVTQIRINGTSITTSWQGFYGNITGKIMLADAQGNNFYDWNLSNPSGEVYASRSNAVTWANINCSSATNITAEETALGQNATDPDSVSRTFTSVLHPAFDVGAVNVHNCSSTQAYNSSGTKGSGFWQVILSDKANTVYTTVLDKTPQKGFNNLSWDFQLMVGENGKPGNETTATQYYFYVELQ